MIQVFTFTLWFTVYSFCKFIFLCSSYECLMLTEQIIMKFLIYHAVSSCPLPLTAFMPRRSNSLSSPPSSHTFIVFSFLSVRRDFLSGGKWDNPYALWKHTGRVWGLRRWIEVGGWIQASAALPPSQKLCLLNCILDGLGTGLELLGTTETYCLCRKSNRDFWDF
jgi:hypothetical protein